MLIKVKIRMERGNFIRQLIDENFIVEEWVDFSPAAFEATDFILNTVAGRGEKSHPKGDLIFRALNECKPEDLKVIILGMDPYIDGSATGLAFDNKNDESKLSPSLKAILKELDKDVSVNIMLDIPVSNSYLGHLPAQGVLLLNTALTVQHKKSGSHIQLWKPFTEQLIKDTNKLDNIVWILWGNHAKGYKKLITNKSHHIIEGGHPSPLNRTVPFAGGKYFSKCNDFLRTINKTPIQW